MKVLMTQRVMLAKKMKHRYKDNHYTITWIISLKSVDESKGNIEKEDDTDYHPIYCTWVISLWDMKVSMTQRVMLAKKMKDRYTDNHYAITWIISHESVDESKGNDDKEDDTGYHPSYLGYLSVDPESNRLSSNLPGLSIC
jgi:hypothetical protein